MQVSAPGDKDRCRPVYLPSGVGPVASIEQRKNKVFTQIVEHIIREAAEFMRDFRALIRSRDKSKKLRKTACRNLSPPPLFHVQGPVLRLTLVSAEFSRVFCTTAVNTMPPISAKPFWTLPACFVTCPKQARQK